MLVLHHHGRRADESGLNGPGSCIGSAHGAPGAAGGGPVAVYTRGDALHDTGVDLVAMGCCAYGLCVKRFVLWLPDVLPAKLLPAIPCIGVEWGDGAGAIPAKCGVAADASADPPTRTLTL